MQLSDIRSEVLNHGFDPVLFGSSRVNQYINDGLMLVCRRVDYYIDMATQAITTSAGTNLYAFPTDFARLRSLYDADREVELEAVQVRDIDRSSTAQGTPGFYAINGQNVELYPTPDGLHNLVLRYWKLPATLMNDTDVPTLPTDWHHILWVYAVWLCYEAEDDAQMGQYWQQRFTSELAEFTADQRFPSTDYPTQAQGMWDSDRTLTPSGWSLYTGYN